MKATQKFLNGDDEAVSPVIAVILMVAITVVLAATVYVWVSGFGAQSSQPAKSIALTSAGALDTTNSLKSYTVASATSGMKYSDFTVTLNGGSMAFDPSASNARCAASPVTVTASDFTVCSGGTLRAQSAVVQAGDVIWLKTINSGDTLRLLDSNADSVMLTLKIG